MKTITVRDEKNAPYVLTFTAETVKQLESQGFSLDEITAKPMTMIPMLFEGAFLAKEAHKVTSEKVAKIYKAQKNKTDLVQKLIKLYNDPIEEAIVKEGNTEWEANF